ncbi:hypothetical protein BCR34DRAFT_576623 [Clohesyomyces aquaticus]|uniref:Tat pathway signal sequence n=1 Tax=Clohesyomyces aquaticus TaxID=1231657 RepID=A0A1Y1YN08_9PLEO|nr:hypothetical protein BCR34DRAFT_576623 [Clohesyomyces aquaticus]
MEDKSHHYSQLIDSSSEAGASDDSIFEDSPHPLYQRRRWTTTILPWATTVLAVLLILSNIIWVRHWMDHAASQPTEYYLKRDGHTLNGVTQVKIETLPAGFLDDNMTVSDAYWSSLFPEGDGVVALPQSWVAAKNLPPSIRSPDDQTQSVYIMAAFHQLHCLTHIRQMLTSYYFDESFAITKESVWGHTRHCMDALRQWILCHPDETLLYKRDGELPGEGQMRTCKNFDAYKEWAEEHSYVYPD